MTTSGSRSGPVTFGSQRLRFSESFPSHPNTHFGFLMAIFVSRKPSNELIWMARLSFTRFPLVNCDATNSMKFSKVYVGAEISESQYQFMRRFLTPHGTLIAPVGNTFKKLQLHPSSASGETETHFGYVIFSTHTHTHSTSISSYSHP